MTSADEPYGLFDAEFLRKLQLLEILFLKLFVEEEDLILRYLREAMVLA